MNTLMVDIETFIKKVARQYNKEIQRNNTMAAQMWGSRLKTLQQAKIVLEKCKEEL